MKKTLVAIAALTLVGAAFAQSSVTLYGRIDASIASTKTKVGGTTTADPGVQIRAGAHTGNRWGLRGSEDLGGGMKANFQLENGFAVDTGQPLQGGNASFGRQAWVGLSGGFGELRVGRQYDTIDDMYGAHDAMGYSGYGAMNYAFNANCATVTPAVGANVGLQIQGPGDCIGRQNNAVRYSTPSMGGFSAAAMWAPGENKTLGAAGVSAGKMYGLEAGYANGPINIGGAWQYNKASGAARKVTNYELGGSYDLGMAKVFLQFEGAKVDATGEKDTGVNIGATMPLGATTLMASYARENQKVGGTRVREASAFSLMAQYALSKRTYVYAAVLRGETDPTAAGAPTIKQQNYGLGLVHNF